MSSHRLRAEESRRVRAAVAIAALLLVPGLARRWHVPNLPSPTPSCGQRPALEPDGSWVCPSRRAPISGIEALWLGRPLDLNRARAEDLQVVPGIGPALSARLVEDRAARGAFTSLEEVERVKGIGPVLRRRLEAWVRVAPPPDPAGPAVSPHERGRPPGEAGTPAPPP